MADINTIKNLLYFFPYLKEETWYMLGIGITVYVIYIAYLVAFERYYRSQNGIVPASLSGKKPIYDILNGLSPDDTRFFERLSLVIRTYLEDSKQVPFATRKTRRDIRGELVSHELQEVLDICTHYEYAGEEADTGQKTEILERLKGIL